MSNDIPNMSEKELRNAERIVLRSTLPTLVETLLDDGTLDINRVSDLHYVWEIVKNNRHVMQKMGVVFDLEGGLMKAAQSAVVSGHSSAAVILVATVIEHKLNMFYRNMLELKTDLSEQMIIDVIRNSLHAKLGWIMRLVSEAEIPQEIAARIRRLADLRNTIVHYKAIPSESLIAFYRDGSLFSQLENLDMNQIIALPEELSDVLESILKEVRPHRKKAEEITEAMLSM